MEILKTGVLHKEICVLSLWETVKCRDKGKNKRMLHKDAFLRMCGCAHYTSGSKASHAVVSRSANGSVREARRAKNEPLGSGEPFGPRQCLGGPKGREVGVNMGCCDVSKTPQGVVSR